MSLKPHYKLEAQSHDNVKKLYTQTTDTIGKEYVQKFEQTWIRIKCITDNITLFILLNTIVLTNQGK